MVNRLTMSRDRSSAIEQAKPLEGKVALITGASRGIGLAIARSFARLGGRLALCARDAGRLERIAVEFQSRGHAVFAVAADLSQVSKIAPLVEEIEQSLGAIEILVNN